MVLSVMRYTTVFTRRAAVETSDKDPILSGIRRA